MFLTISNSDTRRICRKAVRSFFEYPDFLRRQRVNEIRLMGGDEYLRRVPSPGGVSTEFPRQCFKELVIKAVLRLLDTDEGRRIGVFQQQQISKYLERAVGHLLGEKRVTESPRR